MTSPPAAATRACAVAPHPGHVVFQGLPSVKKINPKNSLNFTPSHHSNQQAKK